MKCLNCQTENADGAKFCGQCGQSLHIETACPKCGYQNSDRVKFCNECGHSLIEPVTPPIPQPVAPLEPVLQQPVAPRAAVTPEPVPPSDDRYQIQRFAKIPRFNLLGVILGLLLLISVFLPWIQPSESWGDGLPSASGQNLNGIIGQVGLTGGLLLIGVAFLPMVRFRKIIHALVGLGALVAIAYLVLIGAIPVLDEFARSLIVLREGLFLYCVVTLALLVVGFQKRRAR
ncbi:zinc-ribbon domain-containing protein [Chloroflexota bacterium]